MSLTLFFILLQVSGGATAGGSAVTAPPGKPAAGAASAAARDPDKVVCKDDSQPGQRITRKICRRQAEWDTLAVGAEAYLRDRRGNAPPGRTN